MLMHEKTCVIPISLTQSAKINLQKLPNLQYSSADLDPHCLQYRLPKNITVEKQITKVMTGGLRVNILFVTIKPLLNGEITMSVNDVHVC